ncbi:MAG: T9SS type A sorting domain-containing protein [Ferruginibacter sp.]
MKNLKRQFILRSVLSFLVLIIYINTEAQVQTPRYNISMTTNSNGFYEYLPKGYSSGQNFPLLIFCHGVGENGDGSPAQLSRVLNNGTPKQISQGIFPDSFFTTGGQSYKFIVISPQFTQWPSPYDISNIIDYCQLHYHVDINRIYLTGLSMGGGVVWDYAGWTPQFPTRIAAIVPISGASNPYGPREANMAAANLAIWATHNLNDPTVPSDNTIQYVDGTNAQPLPPNPLAKKTIFPVYGHDAWDQTYDFNFTENGLNIYQWMLQFKRNFVTLAVGGLEFNAAKKDNDKILLSWKTVTESNNRGFEIQRSNDGVNFTTVTFVNGLGTNGNGAVYSFTDAAPLNGRSYYRLKQIDNDNNFKYSEIRFVDLVKQKAVTAYPNPVLDVLNINVSGYDFSHALLRIIDVNGRVVKQQVITGNGSISVPVKDLSHAVYAAEITEGSVSVRFRFVKE